MAFKKPCIIVDIDGTLANIEHRRHYVMEKPKNWKAFNDAMEHDTVNEDIASLVDAMKFAGFSVVLASGRGEEKREVTEHWLMTNGLYHTYEKLYMRPEKDYRPDTIIKQEILEQIKADGYEPFMAIDDRSSVVKMWRENGIRCLQVDDGDF